MRGPGPGRYGLPSTCGQNGHDFTKLMKPAFSFGKRLGNSLVDGVSLKYRRLNSNQNFRNNEVLVQFTTSGQKLPDTVARVLQSILNKVAERLEISKLQVY